MKAQLYALRTTSLFGISAGSGSPVICLHGITANAHVFEPIVRLLADDHHVVSIDQRGHGRSGRPGGYEADHYAEDVVALVEHLASGPAILLGHSLGARNALVAAVRRSELVRGVVAVDFTPFIEPQVFDDLEARVNGGDRVFADVADIEAYLTQRYPRLPRDAIQRRARYGYGEAVGGFRPLADPGAMSQTATGLRASLEGVVRAIDRPTVLVRGARSKLVSPTAWTRTRELRPDLTAVEIDDADHYVPEEQPNAIAALVRRVAGT
jgi:2-(acetamidomethylene)succinate hydrolase